jgi:hypothetical protein
MATIWPRLRAWLARYGPAEAGDLLGTLAGAAMVAPLWGDVGAAYGGTIGSFIGFYGLVALRDIAALPVRRPRLRVAFMTMRNLAVEFGPSEVADSLLVRPAMMYLGANLVGHSLIGVLLGKLAADLVFYGVAAIGYRFRKPVVRQPCPRTPPTAYEGRATPPV